MAKAGRKEIQLDWKMIELYCKSGSKRNDIAKIMGVAPTTLQVQCKKKFNMDFQSYKAKMLSTGDQLLEAAMFQKAMNSAAPGNTPMLMFLAKCRLGYKEPESLMAEAANQALIDKDHEIMALKHQIYKLEREVYALTHSDKVDSTNIVNFETQEQSPQSQADFD